MTIAVKLSSFDLIRGIQRTLSPTLFFEYSKLLLNSNTGNSSGFFIIFANKGSDSYPFETLSTKSLALSTYQVRIGPSDTDLKTLGSCLMISSEWSVTDGICDAISWTSIEQCSFFSFNKRCDLVFITRISTTLLHGRSSPSGSSLKSAFTKS